MDKGKRPVGRQKKVTSGSGSLHKRGEGLHMGGPVGNKEGYTDRKPEDEGDRGIIEDALTGGLGGAGSSNNMEEMVEKLVIKEAVKAVRSGKITGKKLIGIGVLVLIAFMLFGGFRLFSSMGTGLSQSHDLLSSYSPGLGGQATGSGSSGNTGILNREVSADARDKRTVIAGNGKDTITIMVYMCGTDLESKYGMATADLQEMAAAEISSQINLLVYTGGCQTWKNSIVSNEKNQIYQVKEGGVELLEKNMGRKSMTDPDTLAEYIQWGKKNFPADRYDLIMWDHGGGSGSGYGYDQLFANSGSMTLDKIHSALKDGGCTFDFIGFDACLMATLETALVLEPYADYLIASEETEPGVGWYYTNWLTKLSDNTSMETLEIGKNIVDDFVNVCSRKTPSDQTTLSVIDLAEVKGTVPESFETFAQATTELIEKNQYKTVSNARSRTKEFAKSAGIDQVDLIHLAENMGTPEGKELAEVLRSAVKYNLTSGNVNNAYGISIYFPYGKLSAVNKMADTYNKIGLDKEYTKCIKSFASLEVSGQSVAGGTAGQMGSLFGALLSGGSGYSGSTPGTGDMVSALLGSLLEGRSLQEVGLDEDTAGFIDKSIVESQVEYLTDNQFDTSNLLWESDGKSQVMKLKEEQWDLIQTVELNVFADDGEGYIDLGLDNVYEFDDNGNLCGNYDGTWMAINGNIVAYYMMSAEEHEEGYTITGRVPVMLNGEQADLILTFTRDNPDGEVIGARPVYSQQETDTVAKGLVDLEEGDTIDFLCDYYTYEQEFQDNYYLGEQMTVEGDLEISSIQLEDVDWLASYRFTDIYNNHYWTPTMGQ